SPLDLGGNEAVVLAACGRAFDDAEVGPVVVEATEQLRRVDVRGCAIMEDDVEAVGIEHRSGVGEPVRVVHGARLDDAWTPLAARIAAEIWRVDQRDLETRRAVGY